MSFVYHSSKRDIVIPDLRAKRLLSLIRSLQWLFWKLNFVCASSLLLLDKKDSHSQQEDHLLCISFCPQLGRWYLTWPKRGHLWSAFVGYYVFVLFSICLFFWFRNGFNLALLGKRVTGINTGRQVLTMLASLCLNIRRKQLSLAARWANQT